MFGSVILDVAIGMAYIYLLLSLVASVINEALASLVQSRAANLQRGLRSLLSGDSIEVGVAAAANPAAPAGGGAATGGTADKVADAITLVDHIYDHGLIRGLYPDPLKDLNDNSEPGWWSRLRLWLQRMVGIAPAQAIAKIKNPLLLPSYIPARTFALAMIDILSKSQAVGNTPIEKIEAILDTNAAADPKNKVVEALRTLVMDAKSDVQTAELRIQKFQTNLENWYNDGMDRVSGWYKRYTQKVLLIIGLAIAIGFNVDSIRVAHMLWVDRDARTGMANAAADYMKTHSASPASTGQPANSGSSDLEADLQHRMESSVQAVKKVTGDYLLPLGWRHSRQEYLAYWDRDWKAMICQTLLALIGWLITAGALSLGASFWFDTLNKIMVIRNTVKPQEKSQIEGSKD